MGENSKIEWTDHTFNPWMGCSKVAAGCTNCYAERDMDLRYGKVQWGPAGTRVKTSNENWRKPLKWNREAAEAGVRKRVFCASLADVFEDWGGPILDSNGKRLAITPTSDVERFPLTMNDLRRDLFALIDATPHLDWLLLTKRPENVLKMWEPVALESWKRSRFRLHRDNVWLLTSVAEQKDADRNVPALLECRDLVPVLGLSCEPLLGPVDLNHITRKISAVSFVTGSVLVDGPSSGMFSPILAGRGERPIDWVIVGGESGPDARPMHPDWARSLRDQCQAAGVPFFFKQWGEWGLAPHFVARRGDRVCYIDNGGEVFGKPDPRATAAMIRVGKKAAGRELDGREWSEFPPAISVAV